MSKPLKAIFYLSLLGTLFALTVTLRQYVAPTDQPGILSCVGLKIWGLSPCPYGLTLFFLLWLTAGLMLKRLWRGKLALISLRLLAVGGVLFSGWVAWRELGLPLVAKGSYFWETFSLAAIPACVWGLAVFLAIAILAFSGQISRDDKNNL